MKYQKSQISVSNSLIPLRNWQHTLEEVATNTLERTFIQ